MSDLNRPLLIYDGDCAFCRAWVNLWRQWTGDQVEYAPWQDVGSQYPQIDPERFKRSVHLVLPDGEVRFGAFAVFSTLAYAPQLVWMLWAYRHVPGVATIAEGVYGLIPAHRDFAYRFTWLAFGLPLRRATYYAVEWLFLRALGLIYLAAFGSLLPQIRGLWGSHGISPAAEYLNAVAGSYGIQRYYLVPTIFWMDASDRALMGIAVAGVIASLLLIANVLPRVMTALLFVFYLSFISVGQAFLSFQWDLLLTETGFLAIFLGSSRLIVWAFRWLLFRLYLLSGVVKLLSGDPTWHSLKAMRFHYETQPLPSPLAWYVHQAPDWFQTLSCALVLLIETIVPFLVLMPRRFRLWAFWPIAGLQVLIILTGNYAFFNWLTIALCFFLLDDAALPAWIKRWERPIEFRSRSRWMVAAPAAVLLLLTATVTAMAVRAPVPQSARSLLGYAAPFGVANSYGLFAVMTTERPEIIIEGSNDGTEWKAYEFPYKPGDVRRMPRWVAPYQPRLDWQMWFAALGTYEENPWLLSLMGRLLHGSPEALSLFSYNPFPQAPPKYVRATRYQYHFTTWGDKSGAWWRREPAGTYLPAIGLRQ